MTTIVNTHQSAAWNGYEGRHWAANRDRYDAVNGGMNEPLLRAAAIGAADHVLDIGCGTGQTTRLAAGLGEHATGIDLSGPMLDTARAASAGFDNITFEQGDAQVFPFPANGFDVAISRGGMMFFADATAAFTNVLKALRPGGRLAFVCAQDVRPDDDFTRLLAPLWTLMHAYSPPAADEPGPTSLADPDHIREVLAGAGFTEVAIEPITVPMVFGRDADDAAAFLFDMGPMHFALAGAPSTEVETARRAVADRLRVYQQDGQVVLTAGLWLVAASH